MSEIYEPQGMRFFDVKSGREILLIDPEAKTASHRGWLCYRHPDGQWVTLRKATEADLCALLKAAVSGISCIVLESDGAS